MSIEEYGIEKIIKNQIKDWFKLISETGIIFSPHGQNVLVSLNKKGEYQRLVYRDFQGRTLVYKVLKAKNIILPPALESEEKLTDSQRISLIYDVAIGRIFFDRAFLRLAEKGVSIDSLVKRTKKIFNDCLKESELVFTSKAMTYEFSNEKRVATLSNETPRYR